MNSSDDSKKAGDQHWSQLAIAAMGMVVSALGLKNPEYSWLIYAGVIIIFVSLGIIISDSFIVRFFIRKIHERNIKKILKSNEKNYIALVDNLGILDELLTEVSRLRWEDNRPPCGNNYSNSIYDLNNRLSQIPKGIKILFVNSIIREMFLNRDDYLYASDVVLSNGGANFESDHHMRKIRKILRKYESFLNKHNAFCKRINEEVGLNVLHELHGHDLEFDWGDAKA